MKFNYFFLLSFIPLNNYKKVTLNYNNNNNNNKKLQNNKIL
jgi:hypothetical protein